MQAIRYKLDNEKKEENSCEIVHCNYESLNERKLLQLVQLSFHPIFSSYKHFNFKYMSGHLLNLIYNL